MRNRAKRGFSLFLMELLIAILFFSLAAAACIQMFVKAWSTSQKAGDINNAQNCAESMAAVLDGAGTSFEEVKQYFPGIQKEENRYVLFYNTKWKECKKEEEAYRMELAFHTIDHITTSNIRIKDKKQNEIYKLSVESHIPRQAGQRAE